MRRLVPLFLLLACTELELKNYACGALCRESGQSEIGQWSEKLDDCTCQVKGNFEGMREKKLVIRAKKLRPHAPKSVPYAAPVYDYPSPLSLVE